MFYLLLTLALDMSRPEFQPTPDISGNYIVGSYDISSDEIVVDSFEENPIDNSQDILNDLLLSTSLVSDSSAVLLPTSSINLHLDSATQIITEVGTGKNTYIYVELQPNVTYTIDTDAPRLILTTSFTVGNSYTSTTDTTFTPSEFMYGFVLNTRYLNVSYVPSSVEPDDPSGNNPDNPSSGNVDLNPVVSRLDSVIVALSGCELILLFSAVVPFLTKVIDKLMNKKED